LRIGIGGHQWPKVTWDGEQKGKPSGGGGDLGKNQDDQREMNKYRMEKGALKRLGLWRRSRGQKCLCP
jgi:hypothetical protein